MSALALTLPLAVVLLIPAAAAAVAGLRGRSGELRLDSRLGVHGPAAESSNEAFVLANRVAAPVSLAAAAVLAFGAILVLALPLQSLATVVVFAVTLLGGVVLLLAGGTLGERAAQNVPPPTRAGSCDGCACGGGGCSALAALRPTAEPTTSA